MLVVAVLMTWQLTLWETTAVAAFSPPTHQQHRPYRYQADDSSVLWTLTSDCFTVQRSNHHHKRAHSSQVIFGSSSSVVDTISGPFQHKSLTAYWGQEPLLMRQAFPVADTADHRNSSASDGHDDNNSTLWPVITWEDLIHLACSEDEGASARLIRHIPNQTKSFTLELGPFDPDNLQNMMKSHENYSSSKYKWTLIVNDVDRYISELSTWMDQTFDFLPRWRRDDAQISLAEIGGGIGPHVDDYDVFLIQATGTRTWKIAKDGSNRKSNKLSWEHEKEALIPNLPVRILQTADLDFETLTLQPGDVLYLPPRVVHWGTALSDDCMTISVGCRAPSASELVARVAEMVQETVQERFSDPYLLTVERSQSSEFVPSISKENKEKMKQLVTDAVSHVLDNDDAWDLLVGGIVTEETRYSENTLFPFHLIDDPDYLERWGNSPSSAVGLVKEGQGFLERVAGISFATSTVTDAASPDQTTIRLHAHGEQWQIHDCAMADSVFGRIERGLLLDADCLAGISPMLEAILVSLVEKGFLLPNDDEDVRCDR